MQWFVHELICFGAAHWCPVPPALASARAAQMDAEHVSRLSEQRQAAVSKYGRQVPPQHTVGQHTATACPVHCVNAVHSQWFIRMLICPSRVKTEGAASSDCKTIQSEQCCKQACLLAVATNHALLINVFKTTQHWCSCRHIQVYHVICNTESAVLVCLQTELCQPQRATQDVTINQYAYIRVHVHPKRFPAVYSVDWKVCVHEDIEIQQNYSSPA